MKFNFKHMFSEYTPVLSFWLLFPGFFIYQVLINLSVIPSFLGGYFGIVSMILFVPLLFLFFFQIIKSPKSLGLLDVSFLLLMLYIFLVSVSNYLLGEMAGYYDLLYWSLSGVIFNLVCYFIAKYFNYDNKKARRVLLVTFLLVAVLFYLNVRDGIFSLLNSGIEGSVTYQGYARSIVAVSLILIASYRSALVTIALTTFSTVILIIVGSRSELILYVGTLVVTYYVIKSSSITCVSLVTLLSLVALIIFGLNSNIILASLENTRLYEFIENGVFDSSSGQSRLELVRAGWANIVDNPIFGRYGIYVKHFGSIGAYPHNLLSAWLNLGIIGFIGYLSLIFAVLFKALRVARNHINSYSLLALFFAIFIFVAFLTSKDYLFMFFGLSVGFSQNIYKNRVI
jgi:O-antigen ligase